MYLFKTSRYHPACAHFPAAEVKQSKRVSAMAITGLCQWAVVVLALSILSVSSARPFDSHQLSAAWHLRRHRRALVTLLDSSNVGGLQGARTLLKSVLRHAPRYFDKHVMMIVDGNDYDPLVLSQARVAGWSVRPVLPVVPLSSSHNKDVGGFAKLRALEMEEFDEVVYMDPDVVFVNTHQGQIISTSAYPNTCMIWAPREFSNGTWTDRFTLGVFGVQPNATEFKRLMDLLLTNENDFNHIDLEKGFLNVVYPQATGAWCEIEFERAADVAIYGHQREFWLSAVDNIQVIQFTLVKPWECTHEYQTICELWQLETDAPTYPVTVVTGYFAGPNKHGEAKYRIWAPYFMQQPGPVVIFTDNPDVPGLSMRDPTKTLVVVVNKTSFLASHKLFNWEGQLAIDPMQNIHSTHLFQEWLEKTNFVTKAININPFNSSYYVWVDIGCFRNNNWGDRWIIHAERFPDDQMLILKMPGQPNPNRVGGTIFGGHTHVWPAWHHHFYTMLELGYRRKAFVGDDQVVMSMVVVSHPKLVCIIPNEGGYGDPWFFLQPFLAGTAPAEPCVNKS